jgi:hypothetical protein
MTGVAVREKVKVLHVDGSESWAVPQTKHPAVYSAGIVDVMAEELAARSWPGKLVLDPFAGKGEKLAQIEALVRARGRRAKFTGVEIEAEWAACAAFGAVLVGDSTSLPAKWRARFGAVITSPCYGNRFADHHNNRDACKTCRGDGYTGAFETCGVCKGSGLSSRRSYTHDMGHALEANNAGAMHYGTEYRELHRAAWAEVWRVLKPGGLFLMNTKDFLQTPRGGTQKRVRVSEWHRRTILKLGFEQESTVLVPVGGLKHGANRQRIANEMVYAFRKAA